LICGVESLSKYQQEEITVTELVPPPPTLRERVLLLELNHRINNEFTSAINRVSVAPVQTDNVEVKTALSQVVELLHQHADVHRALQIPDLDEIIDAAQYLQTLCRSMSRSKLSRMDIKLVLAADTMWLHSARCWQLGIIVYELATNVARHAFFEGKDGEVRVDLSRAGAYARCGVSDSGSAVEGATPARGLKIIGDLAKSLGGQVDHSLGVSGSSFMLALPFIEEEQRANRSRHAAYHIGSARTEGTHHAQQ
jgi:two-component sensor histidine kinase